MLTDTALKRLKPKEKAFKVSDRDGMYVFVTKAGTVSFRYDYRINGRRETYVIGQYGRGGITLSEARERCLEARRKVAEGISPALEKRRLKEQQTVGDRFALHAAQWIENADLADSTRAMRRHILERDVLPFFGSRLMTEIEAADLRSLCKKVKARGAPATALHVRDIVKQIYGFANLHGAKFKNPADDVAPSSITSIKARDRALSPQEIRLFHNLLEEVAADAPLKLGLRLILLTLVRKSEAAYGQWDEVDFEAATWTIPKERMKRSKDHVVYLSGQALDIMVALKTCAGGSRYLFPNRYDPTRHVSNATFNRITSQIRKRAAAENVPLEPFTVHDLRRTGSTLLNELGFNRDWIEKALAHEDSASSRGVYNKAEYSAQRRHMLQEWADMIDAWVAGERRAPVLSPPDLDIYGEGNLI